jgi:hypothetical protein
MTQTLYAHMNKRNLKKETNTIYIHNKNVIPRNLKFFYDTLRRKSLQTSGAILKIK